MGITETELIEYNIGLLLYSDKKSLAQYWHYYSPCVSCHLSQRTIYTLSCRFRYQVGAAVDIYWDVSSSMFDSSNTSSNIHTDTAQVTPSTPGKHNSTQLNTQLSNTECPFLSRLVIGQYSRRIILYSRGEASSTCMYAYNRVCLIPWLTLDSRRVTWFDSFMVRCIRKGKPISVWYWWWRISVNGDFRYFLHSISTWKMYQYC